MIFTTVQTVRKIANVTEPTQFGAILKQENVIVILDGKVVIVIKVG
jgi:hypothetical protein